MTGRGKGMKSVLTLYEKLPKQIKATEFFLHHYHKYTALAHGVLQLISWPCKDHWRGRGSKV